MRKGAVRVPAIALINAELGRAVRTRSTLVFLTVAAVVTLMLLLIRALALGGATGSESSELVFLSADVIGFVVMFSAALSVARDHQTGSIDLIRVLVPVERKQLVALAAAQAMLAVAVVLLVSVIGAGLALAADWSSFSFLRFADGFSRLTLVSVSLAFAGAGVGALCRSSAAATFSVLLLYLLLPVVLIVAGLSGQAWAAIAADATLGLLGSTAISTASNAWTATVGVGLWAAALTVLGILRATRTS